MRAHYSHCVCLVVGDTPLFLLPWWPRWSRCLLFHHWTGVVSSSAHYHRKRAMIPRNVFLPGDWRKLFISHYYSKAISGNFNVKRSDKENRRDHHQSITRALLQQQYSTHPKTAATNEREKNLKLPSPQSSKRQTRCLRVCGSFTLQVCAWNETSKPRDHSQAE